jgi:hypothetical protein
MQILEHKKAKFNFTLSSLVSLESLYGIYGFVPFSFASHNALMQFPSVKSDLLMFAPSMSLIPRLKLALALSDPARSINDNFPILISASNPVNFSLNSTCTCRMA